MQYPPSTSTPPSISGNGALSLAVEAARRGGDIIRWRFYTQKEIRFKSRANPVTDVDVESERAILKMLRHEYPDFSFLSEESEPVVTESSYTWIIDPLDGTRNYVLGVPHIAVNIALARQGEVLLGVTHDPMRNETFTAEKGEGAYLNGAPISASAKEEVPQCLLGFDIGVVDERAAMALDLVRSLWPGLQSIRIMGSAALGLAYAACGRMDIYFHHHVSPWDIGPGLLLMSEAGGTMVDRHGHPATLDSASVGASSPGLISQFLEATEGLEWRQ